MTPEERESLIRALSADEVRNISIINFVRDKQIHGVQWWGRSVLVRGRSDHDWVYVSSDSIEELNGLAGSLTEADTRFAAIEEWMIPALRRGLDTVWTLPMVRFAFPQDVALPPVERQPEPLTAADAAWMYENSDYREFISVEYTRDCIAGGPSVGIREDGVLIAWAMTQDDGAMGFLHVLESHRRKGYGRLLTIALAGEVRRRGRLPFAYVAEQNDNSISLLTGLGFRRDRKVQWFELRLGTEAK